MKKGKFFKEKLLLFNIFAMITLIFLCLKKCVIVSNILYNFLIGFVVSSFFFLIVVYLPEKNKKKYIRQYLISSKARVSNKINDSINGIEVTAERDALNKTLLIIENLSKEFLIDLELLLVIYKEYMSIRANNLIFDIIACSKRCKEYLIDIPQTLGEHTKRFEALNMSKFFLQYCQEFVNLSDSELLS